MYKYIGLKFDVNIYYIFWAYTNSGAHEKCVMKMERKIKNDRCFIQTYKREVNAKGKKKRRTSLEILKLYSLKIHILIVSII